MIDVDTARAELPAETDSAARRILFLGTHGQANIGDELLLTTFLHQLGHHHRYVVNSYDPERTSSKFAADVDIEVIATTGDRWRLLRHLVSCDAVIFGGGSIVKELYSSVGRWRYATLVMVLAIVAVARAARRPVLLCGVGVGPIDTRLGRVLAAAIVRAANLVSVRDATSYETCRSIGARPDRVVRIPDPAFVNGADRLLEPGCDAPAGTSTNGRVRIALNLNRDIANGDRWDDVLAELTETFDLVADRIPVEIHALPMQSEFKEHDDATVLRAFLAGHPQWNPVFHDTADHIDIAQIIAECDLVVSERFHAIVLAAIVGRPAIGLLYDVKVAELADQLGIDDRSVDINAPFDPAALADAIVNTATVGAHEGIRLHHRADAYRAELDDHFDDVRRWLADPSGNRTWSRFTTRIRRPS